MIGPIVTLSPSLVEVMRTAWARPPILLMSAIVLGLALWFVFLRQKQDAAPEVRFHLRSERGRRRGGSGPLSCPLHVLVLPGHVVVMVSHELPGVGSVPGEGG